eukprot:TRINITY_DN74521_c0_g1_i1.p1 TRINITY_DN74521_c0_g1~~TRINITY_DN74521_c0_g1_i1.p1  ORF type:complete len:511 (+),score=96.13 TRINITY_DN74521_c0_g1_i1:105-1637(+)
MEAPPPYGCQGPPPPIQQQESPFGSQEQTPSYLAASDLKYQRQQQFPRTLLLVGGSVLLLIVMLVPLLDAMRLLSDPTYVFFLGRKWPLRIIQLCLGIILLWVFAVLVFSGCARDETKTDVSVYMIATVVVSILGVFLLLIAAPLKTEVEETYAELFTNCHFGQRTSHLYAYAAALQGVRQTVDCMKEASVESCSGYKEVMPYTGFLKDLEYRFQCAGFCYGQSTDKASQIAAYAEPFSPPTACGSVPQVCIDAMDTASTDPMTPGGCCGCRYIGGFCPEVCVAVSKTCTPHLNCACLPVVNKTNPVSADNVEKSKKEAEKAKAQAEKTEELINVGVSGSGSLAEALQRFAAEREQDSSEGDLGTSLLTVNESDVFHSGRLRRAVQGRHDVSLLQEDGSLIPLPGSGEGGWGEENSTNLGAKGIYIPTLFSLSPNNRATCDGMAARDLKYSALDISNVIYWEGVILLLGVGLAGFCRVCSICFAGTEPLSRRVGGADYAKRVVRRETVVT